MMEKKKGLVYSLTIVLLALCCLYVGKLVFLPDQEAHAIATNYGGGQYTISCSGSGEIGQCAVLNTYSGEVVNVFSSHFGAGQSVEWCYWYDEVRTCNKNLQR